MWASRRSHPASHAPPAPRPSLPAHRLVKEAVAVVSSVLLERSLPEPQAYLVAGLAHLQPGCGAGQSRAATSEGGGGPLRLPEQ